MKLFLLALVGALSLGGLFVDTAAAQDRGRDGDRGRDDRGVVIRGPGDSVIILGDGDILDRLPRGGDRADDPLYRGHGGEGIPKFCRTGEGHPVYGIAWCFDRRMRDERVPSYCRTGEGHPEFGRRWCLEEGYGLGSIRGVFRGGDRVFLDLEDEDDLLAVRPSVWERVLDVLLPRGGR